MPSRKPESEVEIGRVVVEALRARGWTVYQEVQSRLGPVADIVAVQGPVLWVVELKRQFGFDVLEQAQGWRGHANLRSIAIPNGLVYSPFRLHVASELGIGVLRVHGPWNGTEVSDPLYELVKPARERRISKALRGRLRTEQQTFADAGGNGRFTPFRSTCQAIRETLRYHGEMPIKRLVQLLKGQHQCCDGGLPGAFPVLLAKAPCSPCVELLLCQKKIYQRSAVDLADLPDGLLPAGQRE